MTLDKKCRVTITKGYETEDGTKIGWPTMGLGRWIYCKYCYKSVTPAYFEEEMIMPNSKPITQSMITCSNCGAGLEIIDPKYIAMIKNENGWK